MSAANGQAIYQALLSQGANTMEAVAIMANMWFESEWNPESSGIDSNGKRSVGLVQWNNNPTAQGLLTGNPAQDIASQVAYLVQTGGIQATGPASDVGTAASNFAHNYEKCAACGYQGGTGQLTSRANYAIGLLPLVTSGQWGKIVGGTSSGGTGGSTPPQQATLTSANPNNTCYIKLPGVSVPIIGTIGGNCLFYESWGRAVAGAGILIGGGVMVLGALVLLVAVKEGPKILGKLGGAGKAVGTVAALVPK